MEELQTLETSKLFDLLSMYTVEYTRMLSDGAPKEEYEKCKAIIKALQAEIELRKSAEKHEMPQ